MLLSYFSSLTGLEVAEKFVLVCVCVCGEGFQVATPSNLNPSYFELFGVELS